MSEVRAEGRGHSSCSPGHVSDTLFDLFDLDELLTSPGDLGDFDDMAINLPLSPPPHGDLKFTLDEFANKRGWHAAEMTREFAPAITMSPRNFMKATRTGTSTRMNAAMLSTRRAWTE